MIMRSFREQFTSFASPTVYSDALLSGVIIASWNIGCFVGAMLTVVVGDRLGRRGSALLGLALEVVGKIIQTCTFSLGQYIAGRVIAGVGNGYVDFPRYSQAFTDIVPVLLHLRSQPGKPSA